MHQTTAESHPQTYHQQIPSAKAKHIHMDKYNQHLILGDRSVDLDCHPDDDGADVEELEGGDAAPFRMFRSNSQGGAALATPAAVSAAGENNDPPVEKDVDTVPMPWLVSLSVLFSLRVLAFIALTSGGAALLDSISGFPFAHCPLLYGVGVATVTAGVVGLVVHVVLACATCRVYHGSLLAFALPLHDGAAWPSTCCRRAGFVVVYVLLPVVVLLIVVGLSILSFFFYSMSLQVSDLNKDFSGAITLKNGTVRLWRDAGGLLYVEAQSQHDAFFGQGFGHAQDRLWQMEFMRLAATGALSKYVGSAALDFDRATRALGFTKAAKNMCDAASSHSKVLMQAYVDGINFYLSSDKSRPPEFLFMSTKLLFFHQPEPFSVYDVCYAAKVLQWQLSLNAGNEAERFTIFWNTERSYDEVDELYQNQTNVSRTIVSSEDLGLTEEDCVAGRAREALDRAMEKELYDSYMTDLRNLHNPSSQRIQPTSVAAHHATVAKRMFQANSHGAEETTTPLSTDRPTRPKIWKLRDFQAKRASNAWSGRAAGDTTATFPVGASDPHLGINLPSVWYWSNLSFPADDGTPFFAAGVGMTGIPGVHIGQTPFVSWGITMTLSDLEDLFLLVPDPANPATHYMVNGTSVAFTERREVIEVYGSPHVIMVVQESIYGPVANEAFDLPASDKLKFAASGRPLLADQTSADAFLSLSSPQIRSVTDFRDRCLASFDSPGLSIAMQDHAGYVAWAMTGKHFIRAVGHTGKLPTLGNGSYDYRGDIPYTSLPSVVKAPSVTEATHVSCANQKIAPDGYGYTLGYDYDYPWRGGRIQAMLAENVTALSDVNRHAAIQLDLQSNIWLDDFVPFLNSSSDPRAAAFRSLLDTNGAALFEHMMKRWDAVSSRGSQTATRFYWFMRTLLALPSDALAALRNADIADSYFWNPQGQYQLRLFWNPSALMLRQCRERWRGDNATALPTASNWCIAFAAQAFNDVAAVPDSGVPGWGVAPMNVIVGQHLMLEGSILACLFEREDYRPGDMSTVSVADFSFHQDGNFQSYYASSMRQLYDWGDKSMRMMLPGGNSGNPYSPYYQNLWDAWFAGEYAAVGGGKYQSSPVHSQTLSP